MSVPAAIKDLVEAAVDPVTVYDGRVPDGSVAGEPPERYVALYIDNGTREHGQVAQESTGRLFRWQTTCVAPDRGMAGWLADRVADALTDSRPAADGFDCGLVEHTFSRTPRPDEQVQERPVVVAIDRYQLLAERLAEPES